MSNFKIGSPTPLLANNCSHTSVVTFGEPEFIINEIKPRNSESNTEFIELKGSVDTPLDAYILVLFTDRGRSSYTVNMSEKHTDHNGLAVVGSHEMVPAPSISFASSNIAIIPHGTGAVALYRGVVTDFPVGTQMTSEGLVDAVVFTSDQNKLDNEMTSVLTPESSCFYSGNWLKGDNHSISRCQCCKTRSNSAFILSSPTPYQTNLCPSDLYSATIQMRLANAAYRIWLENPNLIVELKKEIASGINRYCQCGFNEGYLTDDKIMNGSVIYQATMLAVNSNQSVLLINSYHQYIHNTPKIRLHGTVYVVDGQCVDNCNGSSPPTPETRKGHITAAEEEAIAVLCIVFLSTVIVSVYLGIRYRRPLWAYLKRTRDASVAGELPVMFRRSLNDQHPVIPDDKNENSVDGFANPVYMYQSPSEASVPRIVVQERQCASGRSSPRNVVIEQHTSGRSSPRNVVQEQGASGRSSPRNVVREQGASGRSSPRNVVEEQGASGRSSPRNVVKEQGASGRRSPRNVISDQSSGENGVLRTENILTKAKKILDGTGNFENPLYGLGSSPVKMDLTPDEENGNIKKIELNVNQNKATEENVTRIEKSHLKKDKKKKQESFANPLYGFNAGPAQLEVTITQDEYGAVETTRNQEDLGTVDEEMRMAVQNSAGVTNASGGETEPEEDGIKERFFKKFRRSQRGAESKEGTVADAEPAKFVHM